MNKIEKLELKHLCGYLPHGLKVMDISTNKIILVDYSKYVPACIKEIFGFKKPDIERVSIFQAVNDDLIKPLLLPLSALTEQLPDGNIPIEEMYELFGSKSGFGKLFYQSDLLESLKRGINEVKHKHVEYLFLKHFDVYGLIPSGLAIDKRTVK